jgi:hypothetical protein
MNQITTKELIFETWEDIGRPGLKFFRENMYSEIEASYLCHLLEEILTRYEETVIEDDADKKELKERRTEILYDYYC